MDTITRVISEELMCPLSRVTDDATPNTIEGWDSMATIRIAMQIEQELGLKFTVEELIESFNSVADIRKIVAAKKSG